MMTVLQKHWFASKSRQHRRTTGKGIGIPLFFALILVMILSLPLPAPAANTDSPGADDAQVEITLYPETVTVAGGETLTIVIEQKIAPDWHTYWINPGDSGEPMRIQWDVPGDMPPGFEEEEMRWPVPHKIMIGPLVSYGYENRALILQDISLPDTLPDGPITLTANIELLVCAEICIPEFKTRTLILNDPAADYDAQTARAVIDETKNSFPLPWAGEADFSERNDTLHLSLGGGDTGAALPEELSDPVLIPRDWGVIDGTKDTRISKQNGRLIVRHARGDRPLSSIRSFTGILAYVKSDGTYTGLSFAADPKVATAAAVEPTEKNGRQVPVSAQAPAAEKQSVSIPAALLFALLGGIILNLMPCVFPILSLKALKLCKLSGRDLAAARLDSFLYTAGILTSFAAFAFAIAGLQMAGEHVGWGFQLQNATFVIVLAWLLFLIGLNLSGVYAIGGQMSGVGSGLIKGHDRMSAFFTGVLAAIVATPCTAPFMGVAVGFALTQTVWITLLVFLTLGFGLALPYILLALVPRLRRILPQPGAWMESFKQFLAFPLYASSIWLVWVALQQGGTINLIWALSGALLLAFAIWLFQRQPVRPFLKILSRALAVLAVLLSLSFLAFVSHDRQITAPGETDHYGWTSFSPSALKTALADGAPVFVNMTADWCITCKVNERVALETKKTKALFRDRDIRLFKGDWTNYDPDITAYLKSFGRNGVPLYVYYAPPPAPEAERPAPNVLPQLLTPDIVVKTIRSHNLPK